MGFCNGSHEMHVIEIESLRSQRPRQHVQAVHVCFDQFGPQSGQAVPMLLGEAHLRALVRKGLPLNRQVIQIGGVGLQQVENVVPLIVAWKRQKSLVFLKKKVFLKAQFRTTPFLLNDNTIKDKSR